MVFEDTWVVFSDANCKSSASDYVFYVLLPTQLSGLVFQIPCSMAKQKLTGGGGGFLVRSQQAMAL